MLDEKCIPETILEEFSKSDVGWKTGLHLSSYFEADFSFLLPLIIWIILDYFRSFLLFDDECENILDRISFVTT